MIGLEHYASIKNNYCIGYFGNSDEYLIQLRLLRPFLERRFHGLNIYLSCKDASIQYLDNCDKVIPLSGLRDKKSKFAHVRELRFNGNTHPIADLLTESFISNYVITSHIEEEHTNLCVISTQGSYPTSPLKKKQIDILKRKAYDKGFEIQIDGDFKNAGMVMGVESVGLFEAAAKGLQTYLVPTGVGERLYQNMFPNGEVINI